MFVACIEIITCKNLSKDLEGKRTVSSNLSPWSRVLLWNLTGPQIFEKLPTFYGTPTVHCRTHKIPPPVHVPSQNVQVRGLVKCFVTLLIFLR